MKAVRRSSKSAARSGRDQRGFTLLEVMVAVSLLAMALPSVLMVVVFYSKSVAVAEETARARQALREAVERIQGVPFEQLLATFNANPADDPGVPGTAPGTGFAVAGLDVQSGDADGLAGGIEFPALVAVGGAPQLREDVVDAGVGLPRDLDASGAVDVSDHSSDYVLLPMRVRVRWTGVSGDREVWTSVLFSYR